MIPSHNEEETIGRLVQMIPRHIEGIDDVKVLVMNDASTDQTARIARESGADRVIDSGLRMGLAQIFAWGLRIALGMGADIIVNIDADLQYDPKEIPSLVRPIIAEDADVVLGSRMKGKIEYMPLSKAIGNRIATILTKALSSAPISDAQTGFRALSRQAALRMNIDSTYTYTQEMIMQAQYKGMRIVEIPVAFAKRDGNSRLVDSTTAYAARSAVTMLGTHLRYRAPRILIPAGIIIAFSGLVLGLIVLWRYAETGLVSPHLPSAILTGALLTVGFELVIIGLFADMLRGDRELLEKIAHRLSINIDQDARKTEEDDDSVSA